MAVTLNASNSGTGGLSVTSDATGNLAFQTAGTTALSISASQVVTLTNALAEASGGTGTNTGYYGFKNRIINGAMVIDQRNAGVSGTASGYTIDRWNASVALTTKGTWQQNAGSVTPPVGFTNYLGFTSNSAYTVGSTEQFKFFQVIEGYNMADLAWGTANAKTITLSFWVRSSLTGTFGGALLNGTANRSYPFTYTISSANTWTQASVTISGDTTGTWATDNTQGVYVQFGFGVGATYSGTAGAWAGAYYASATGATSVVGTNGATFYITGVQLEKGSTATSFDYRPYGPELALCQRYYCRFNASSGGGGLISIGWAVSTTATAFSIAFPVTMRTPPTALEQSGTAANYQIVWAGAANALTSVPTFGSETTVDRTRLEASIASVLTTGMALGIRYASTSAYLAWSAEL